MPRSVDAMDGRDAQPEPEPAASARTLTAAQVGHALGYSRRCVTGWCTEGIGGSQCPHETVIKGKKMETIRLNLDEVRAWMGSVGIRPRARPGSETAELPLEEGIEGSRDRGIKGKAEAETEAKATAVQLPRLADGRVDGAAVLEQMMEAQAGLVLTLTRQGISSAQVMQVAGAINNLDKVIRQQLDAMAALERDRTDRVDRPVANRALLRLAGEVAAAVGGADLAAAAAAAGRAALAREGMLAEQASAEEIERLLGAVIGERMAAVLAALAERFARAGAELLNPPAVIAAEAA